MADPLVILRQFNIDKQEIIEGDKQIMFGKISFPKETETNYLIKKPAKENHVKEYYTLECLLFFLKNTNLIHPEYCKSAAEANIPAVRRPDRKQLLAYLNGETETCSSIVKKEVPENHNKVKRTHDRDEAKYSAKKLRVEHVEHTQDKKKRGYLLPGTQNHPQTHVKVKEEKIKKEFN